jgi:hypothetical protein
MTYRGPGKGDASARLKGVQGCAIKEIDGREIRGVGGSDALAVSPGVHNVTVACRDDLAMSRVQASFEARHVYAIVPVQGDQVVLRDLTAGKQRRLPPLVLAATMPSVLSGHVNAHAGATLQGLEGCWIAGIDGRDSAAVNGGASADLAPGVHKVVVRHHSGNHDYTSAMSLYCESGHAYTVEPKFLYDAELVVRDRTTGKVMQLRSLPPDALGPDGAE